MSDGDRVQSQEGDAGADGPLPNRFTRGTLVGCLGILCVLTLPALLFVPVEEFNLPGWMQRLIPLIGVAVVVTGVWLLSRVPSANAPRVSGPERPLTRSGHAPVLERPATSANRAALIAAMLLIVCCVTGYVVISVAGRSDAAVLVGTLITYLAGVVLLGISLLSVVNRMPAPAWHWERVLISRNVGTQAIPFACVGIVAVVWALFVASAQGYFWAPLGVGLVLLAGMLTGPILQRLPERGWRVPSPPPSDSLDTPRSDQR